MKNNIHGILCYNDYEFKLLVFSSFDDKPFLMYERIIDKIKINDLTSDLEKDKLSTKIKDVIEEANKQLSINLTKIDICYDPDKYYYSSKAFTFDFEQSHRVTRADIKKVYVHAKTNEQSVTGFVVTDFSISSYRVNDEKYVANPIGMDVNKLQVYGEMIFVDSKTYYNLVSIVSAYEIEVGRIIVGTYMLKKNSIIEDKTAILDIGTERINFVVNKNEDIKQFSIAVGMKKLYEELYKELTAKFEVGESEDAVRFMMNYFTLFDIPDYMVTENISQTQLASMFRVIVVNYFQYIVNELKSQDIHLSKAYVLLNDYYDVEFISLLNENTTIEFVRYNSDFKGIEKKEMYKAVYAIEEIINSDKVLITE